MKQRISLITILLASLLVSAFPAYAEDSATSLLEKAAAKLTSAQSVTASFTASTGHGSVSGNITASAEKFAASGQGFRTWYDGKTQWTYTEKTQEVTIIEPTPEELVQSNPLYIIRTLCSGYNATMLKSAPGTRVLRMTPKAGGAEFRQVTLTLQASTLLPKSIDVVYSDGSKMNIAVTSIKTGGAVAASAFQFDTKACPGAQINDMR